MKLKKDLNVIKMNMKVEPKKWVMGLCFAGLLAASPVQAAILLTFNENGPYAGNPYVVLPGGTGKIQYKQGTDNLSASGGVPSGGGATTLDYLIPYEGVNNNLNYGWVVVYAPGTSTPGVNDVNIVDLIHFDNSGTGAAYNEGTSTTNTSSTIYGQIFYYSKEGSGNAANNWVSSNTLAAVLVAANTVGITEPSNGQIDYDPAGLGSPGYNTKFTGGAASQQYDFQFNSVVPEPTTIIAGAMLIMPFGVSTLRALRKNRTA